MRLIFQLTLLILYTATSYSSLFTNLKGKASSILKDSNNLVSKNEETGKHLGSRFEVKNNNAVVNKKEKTHKNGLNNVVRISKAHGGKTGPSHVKKVKSFNNKFATKNRIDRSKNEKYRLDPVLNAIRRSRSKKRDSDDQLVTTSDSSSSSMELKNWKTEWKEYWMKKKLEAINSSQPRGDSINMVAARPWGVQCGDPNQHDMPWGSCMLAMECEPEYRIYRGDFLCGRTQFVCCALQLTNYDMYEGFDVSFADTSLSTDSEEKRNRQKGSKERKRRERQRKKRKRRRERLRRKKKLRRKIKKIIKEIRKLLNRQYKNGTKQRKRKTKQLKKFIKDLKKKYRKDRDSVKDIHELNLIKIDSTLMKKLEEIRALNRNFVRNATFRSIVVNGTITKVGARMLAQAYPELIPYFTARRNNDVDEPKDYLDYDVEYGMLYY